uniref:Uncharacterized protein n=1 Tax=Knipowitschia caucasica TaxID=637954 RepID=A0AAV2KDS3_KNICA
MDAQSYAQRSVLPAALTSKKSRGSSAACGETNPFHHGHNKTRSIISHPLQWTGWRTMFCGRNLTVDKKAKDTDFH